MLCTAQVLILRIAPLPLLRGKGPGDRGDQQRDWLRNLTLPNLKKYFILPIHLKA
jgi:hypothetical protein